MNHNATFQLFPRIYEDELFYSIIARYHVLTSNNNFKTTLNEVFVKDTIIPTIEFPSRVDYFTHKLNLNISSDYIIKAHTALPYYSPFNTKQRIDEISYEMKYGKGMGIKHKIGYIAGSICRKNGIYYCHECVAEEYKENGEAYFHRLHQLQGVIVCNRHMMPLMKYSVDYTSVSRLQFIRLDKERLSRNNEVRLNKIYLEKFKKIADVAEYIITNDLATWDKEKVYDKYIKNLKDKGLITVSGRIKQNELFEQFRDYWGEKFLMELDSSIDPRNEYNWLKVLTRKSNRTTHPLRHILFILFLGYNGEDFFVNNEGNNNQKLYPCLNPVADHYKEMIIKNVIITADYKTRKPVGTFECSCGFIYSRKMESDIHTIGRIKKFGHDWRKKLTTLANQKGITLRETARQMSCDPKIIIKYSSILSQEEEKNNISLESDGGSPDYKLLLEQKYIECISKFIQQNPHYNRTAIRNNKTKEYNWLYKNNKSKLDEILPNRRQSNGNENRRVEWDKRDIEIYAKLKKEYELIIENKESVRITKSLLGKRIGCLPVIEKHLDNLPTTKDFFSLAMETIEQYQIRRIDYVINNLTKEEKELVKWRILREAGIRKPYNELVLDKINERIKGE